MKLDSEPTYFNTSLDHDPASKIIEYSDSCWENGPMKADNEVGRDRKKDMASVPESGNQKMYPNALPTEKYDLNEIDDEKGPHCYTGVDSINGTKTDEIELSENELDYYTDKTVTEIELPELIVCYKEESYHVIKDICIDEGMPSLDKILVENNVDHKRAIECPYSDLDENSDLSKEVTNSAVPVSDGLKSLILDGLHISGEDDEVTGKCSSERLLVEGDSNFDAAHKIVIDISNEKVIPENLLSVAELDSGSMHADSSYFDGDEDQQKSDQGANEEANLASQIAPAADSNDDNHTKDFPLSGESESGSITFDFEPLPTDISGREEGAENADCQQQSGRTLNMLVLEDGLSDNLTASSRSFFIHHGYGESSFSGMGPMSGPLTHSGPIPFSGSISHRSDSSTTSTRSFAFPILHSEWNSSPVKMAKANRRHYRKHRGWSLNLLCCRF